MKSDSKLSIIVPVFNGEKYIENTIKNLLNASYQNFELLLIDDGSTDNSFEICKKYEKLDSRVKTYHKDNGGIADARNYGLDHASGAYVGFCDQDDEVSLEMYEKMMERIQGDCSDMAICGCYRKKANGGKVVFERYTDDVLLGQEIREKLLFPTLFRGFAEYENKEISPFNAIWKCIISKNFLDENRLRFCCFVDHEDDLLMLIKLYLRSRKVSTLSDIFYGWNTNASSETYRRRNTYINDLEIRQKSLIDYVERELKNNGVSKDIISKYKYILCCINALQILDNVCLLNEGFSFRMKKIRENESISYIQSRKGFVLPQKGFVRNTIVIPLVEKKHLCTAYFFNQLINAVRYFVERHYIMEIIERDLKKQGKKGRNNI